MRDDHVRSAASIYDRDFVDAFEDGRSVVPAVKLRLPSSYVLFDVEEAGIDECWGMDVGPELLLPGIASLEAYDALIVCES